MHVVDGFAGAVGNTPLIRLPAQCATGCEILGKAEFLNPGGSVKDRAALGIIGTPRSAGARARRHDRGGHGRQHRHRPGAWSQRARLPRVIVIPDNQSQEKIDFLRMIGAEVRLVPAEAVCATPNNY